MKKLFTLLVIVVMAIVAVPQEVMAETYTYWIMGTLANGEWDYTKVKDDANKFVNREEDGTQVFTFTASVATVYFKVSTSYNSDGSHVICPSANSDLQLSIDNSQKVEYNSTGYEHGAYKINGLTIGKQYDIVLDETNTDERKIYYRNHVYASDEYEMVLQFGDVIKTRSFTSSRWRNERKSSMPYSYYLSTVGFKDEYLPGKKGDKVKVYARLKADHSVTLRPSTDGSTFGEEKQPSGNYSSVKSYKSESYTENGGDNTFLIEKGSGVSYTLALNLGDQIKTVSSVQYNLISHEVEAKSLSLYINDSMSEIYKKRFGDSYNELTEDFYLIGAMRAGENYNSEYLEKNKMERTIFRNPITNEVDSVVYSKVVKWDAKTTASGLWFAFAPKSLSDNGYTFESSDSYAEKSAWNYIARPQVQDEFDGVATYGSMAMAGYNTNTTLCDGEQALNPKVDDAKYTYYIVKFNVTTSTYRLQFYEDPEIVIPRTKNQFIRTFASDANLTIPEGMKAFVVQSYKNGEIAGKKQAQGIIELREIQFIPANTGVVLIATETDLNKSEVRAKASVKEDEQVTKAEKDHKLLWKITTYTDSYNNYLVPVLEGDKAVTQGDYNETTHHYATRNFALNWFANTAYAKANASNLKLTYDETNHQLGEDDYLGFFRLNENGKIKNGYAYLQFPSSVLDFNLQFTGNEYDDNVVRSADAKASPMMALLFDTLISGETTGVKNVDANTQQGNEYYYTLEGVRLTKPTKSGLYIYKGKKIMVK